MNKQTLLRLIDESMAKQIKHPDECITEYEEGLHKGMQIGMLHIRNLIATRIFHLDEMQEGTYYGQD